MVEVENASKLYGRLEAVKDVSFNVEKGEIIGLLGPNGAGKTTLMRVMTGYLPATRGTVRIAGFDIFDNPMEVKRHAGYLPENPPLYNDMTVNEYLGFVAEIKGVPRSKRRESIAKVIETAALGDVSERLIENISKGYRQRVGLAQAMVNNPDVLILDEPTVGLDPKQIIEIRELIKSLGREHTIILSSHILSEVSATCDKIVILNKGEVVAIDRKENLFTKMEGGAGRLSVQIICPAEKGMEALAEIDGVAGVKPAGEENGECGFEVAAAPGRDVRAGIFNCAVENKWILVGMSRLAVTLEDVFLHLTKETPAAQGDDAEVK
jgi:ABC-2 type transport system ATP-binding protein